MKTPKQEFLVINSDTVKLTEVESFIENVFRDDKLSFTDRQKILLCVKEAATNAIIHGNRYDKDKLVFIKAMKEGKHLTIVISDEGEGFNYNNLDDPTTKENLFKEGGRGIFLIKKLCNNVEFVDKGNTIKFKINLNVEG